MRKALRIELYDAGVLLGDVTGVFTEYGELESFAIGGDDLSKFYQIFGILPHNYSDTRFSHKEKKEITHWYEPEYLDLIIERRLKSEFWNSDEKLELQAEITPSGLLEILMIWKSGHQSRITYSGKFAIEWVTE